MASLQILAVASMIAITGASPPLPRMLSPSPSPRMLSATPVPGVMTTCVSYVCPSGWTNRPAPENLGCLTSGCTDPQCCLTPTPVAPPPPVPTPSPVVLPPPVVYAPVPSPTPTIIVPVASGTAASDAQARKDLNYDNWPPVIKDAVNKVKTGGEKAIQTLEALPVKEKVGVAVGAAAGAAALGGIISGIANAAHEAKDAPRQAQHADTNPAVVTIVEDVYIPVTAAPGGVPVAAARGVIAKYKQEGGKQAGAAPMIGGSVPQGTLMAVAAFVLFGAFFLGMSGLVIYKLRPRKNQLQSRSLSRFDRVNPEEEESMDSNPGTVEDLPLLA